MAWSAGSYDDVATDFLPVAARLVDTVAVDADERVLDVACGSGNVALTAWRSGAAVTGVDLVPAMLRLAEENAAVMGADDVEWREGDAEDLPFDDGTFDVVLMCLGPEVGPAGDVVARELVRVTKPGGRIGLAAWAPAVKSIFLSPARYLPEPPKTAGPDWGEPEGVRELLGETVRDLEYGRHAVRLNYLSPQHFWAHLVEHVGPFMAMVSHVDEADREALARDTADIVAPLFEANAIELAYLVTTAVKA